MTRQLTHCWRLDTLRTASKCRRCTLPVLYSCLQLDSIYDWQTDPWTHNVHRISTSQHAGSSVVLNVDRGWCRWWLTARAHLSARQMQVAGLSGVYTALGSVFELHDLVGGRLRNWLDAAVAISHNVTVCQSVCLSDCHAAAKLCKTAERIEVLLSWLVWIFNVCHTSALLWWRCVI